jgi:amylosucrase
MYDYQLYKKLNGILRSERDTAVTDNLFYSRFLANASPIKSLYDELYRDHPKGEEVFSRLIQTILHGYVNRPAVLKKRDDVKSEQGHWFLSSQLAGMSLYVDRFCDHLSNLTGRLDYFEKLGVNFLHLMPLFESPKDESDGGYAVRDFRKIDKRFGTLTDLKKFRNKCLKKHVPDGYCAESHFTPS